jgi:hypothetical protein
VRVSFYGWWSDPLRALVEAVGIAAYLTTNDKARYDAWLCLHAPAPSTGDNYGVQFARRWLRDGMPRRPDARRNRAPALCQCENLGWPGVDSCSVHGCVGTCSDYTDAFKGPHA